MDGARGAFVAVDFDRVEGTEPIRVEGRKQREMYKGFQLYGVTNTDSRIKWPSVDLSQQRNREDDRSAKNELWVRHGG